jgi:hypothetical protein
VPIVYLDIDSKVKQVCAPAKQGASFGYTKVRGLHFQIVTASTASSRPVVFATRLSKGSAGSGLASRFHAKATGATIRRTLVNIPARIASSARRIRLHLPEHWPGKAPSPPCGQGPATARHAAEPEETCADHYNQDPGRPRPDCHPAITAARKAPNTPRQAQPTSKSSH